MQPDPSVALWRRAETQFNAAQWPEAQASYHALLQLHPGHPQALLQLSYVESYLGHYRSAHDAAMRAAAGGVRRPEVVSNLVARLRGFGEAEALDAALKSLPAMSHIKIPHLLEFAAQLSYINQQERALAFLEEAYRADPGFPPTLMAYAQILTYLGRFDEAEEYFERCIQRAPQAAQAHWFLSRLRKQVAGSNHVERLEAQLLKPPAGPEDRALLYYALHKELDDLKQYDAAWRALENACREKRALLRYDMAQTDELFDALTAWSPARPGSVTTNAGPGGRVPIFIIGMHRSGTTLLEQMLDGHHDVRGVGELYDFTNQMRYAADWHCRGPIDAEIARRARDADFAAVGAGYLEKMEYRLGKQRYFTDKLPSNFFNAGFICEALPQGKILHMVREPMETCFSNLRELFSDVNAYSYDQRELAHFHGHYRRLMAHWHARYPGRILDVDYARLTTEPEVVMREVAAFCGFEFEPAMVDVQNRERSVATASAIQARQPITALARPKWAPYEEYLQPLIQALRDN